MTYHQKFSETLLQQINKLNSRNLRLHSQLAQKEDHISDLNHLLQNAAARPNQQHLRQHVFDLQRQLDEAQEVNATSRTRFNSVYLDQKKQICSVRDELALAHRELERLREQYAVLQKNYEARNGRRRKKLSPVAPSKSCPQWTVDQDEDDEEVTTPWLKSEPLALQPDVKAISVGSSTSPFTSSSSSEDWHVEQDSGDNPKLSQRRLTHSNEHKVSSQPAAPATLHSHVAKRKRRPEDEVANEIKDLEIIDITSTPTKRKRSCTLSNSVTSVLSPEELREQALHDIKQKFQFQAVVRYDEHNGGGSGGDEYSWHDSKADLEDWVGDLWDAILSLHEAWEEAKGEDWKYEFEEKLRGRSASSCVSAKLRIEGWRSGKSVWRPGGERRFACRTCVDGVKPCFVWTGECFKLLPLHEDDRQFEAKKDHEVRSWLNIE